MKNTILSIAFIVCVFIQNADSQSILTLGTNLASYDREKKTLYFMEDVTVEGVSKTDIYTGVKQWSLEKNTPENLEFHSENKENGSLYFSSNFKLTIDAGTTQVTHGVLSYSIFIFTKEGGYRFWVKDLLNKDYPDENYVIMKFNDVEKEERYRLIWEMYGNVQAQFIAHVYLMARGFKARVMTNKR